MTVSEILMRARNKLNKGWTKGTTYTARATTEGNVCALGALYYGEKGECKRGCEDDVMLSPYAPEIAECVRAAFREAEDEYGIVARSPDYDSDAVVGVLMSFNDDEGTTKEDMLDVFDKMIAHAEKKNDCTPTAD